MGFERSYLFNKTLAPRNDADESMRTKLRDEFLKARANAAFLLDKIRVDFPNLTIHDITHVDSLWEVASVICGEDFPVNPMEGFVLGCSFLIHDAALSYDAVGGEATLRATPEWKDAFYEASLQAGLSDSEKEKNADFNAIRTLHAKYAGSILGKQFERDNHTTFYIIEDDVLRTNLHEVIEAVAESHHWEIEQVRQLPTQQNALPGYPRTWKINPQKLACILRCADAGHIDAGRAPDYLYHILKLNGVSRDHWSAQNKLAVVDVDETNRRRALINSMQSFEEKDFNAWNVASAAVKVFDTEIRNSNKLLSQMPHPCEFQIQEVAGADSLEELSKYIKTNGWEPCEANLRVGDVAGIIKKLGGEALYGKEDHILVALRELIQNARDAIQARSFIDKAAPDGKITISVETVNNGILLAVSDNGLGMSMEVIKDAFLSFGESYWASWLAKKEFPGLRSSGFSPVGKFGIGFYSVFMVATNVVVETRRFNEALDNTITLKFPNGLTLNPIKATGRGPDMNISTTIRLFIPDEKYKWDGQYLIKRNIANEKSFHVPFAKAVSALTAGLDVDVFYKQSGTSTQRVHQNVNSRDFDIKGWLYDISFAREQQNSGVAEYIEHYWRTLERIEENGRLVGIAALPVSTMHTQDFLSINTVGGLATSIHNRSGEYNIGLFDSIPSSASRNGSPVMETNGSVVKQWAEGQYRKYKSLVVGPNYFDYQAALHSFNVDPIDIVKVVLCEKDNGKVYDLKGMIEGIRSGWRIVIVLNAFSSNHIETYLKIDDVMKILGPGEYLLCPLYNSSFLDVNPEYSEGDTTLYGCIRRLAKRLNLNLKIEKKQNYVRAIFGLCDALIISKEPGA